MDVRAAVAFAPGKPLEVADVKLDGPRAGEVLVEIKATGICHTDAYTLDGLDSEDAFGGSVCLQGVHVDHGDQIAQAMVVGQRRIELSMRIAELERISGARQNAALRPGGSPRPEVREESR